MFNKNYIHFCRFGLPSDSISHIFQARAANLSKTWFCKWQHFLLSLFLASAHCWSVIDQVISCNLDSQSQKPWKSTELWFFSWHTHNPKRPTSPRSQFDSSRKSSRSHESAYMSDDDLKLTFASSWTLADLPLFNNIMSCIKVRQIVVSN